MTLSLSVLVADDEPLARERLELLLAECAGVELVATATNGSEALAMIRAHDPDVVLLDIMMPVLDGFDVLEQAAGHPAIIFVTASDRFAVRAFDVAAVDYVLKPARLVRLEAALQRAREAIATRERAEQGEPAQPASPALNADATAGVEDLWVSRQGELLRIPLDHVDWIKAEGEYVRLAVGQQSYLHREPIGRLAARLPAARFVRVHRSTIVRTDVVAAVKRTRYGGLAVALRGGGPELPVGRKYAPALRALTGRRSATQA